MNFKTLLPHLIAVGLFLVVAVIAFSPQFSGKVLIQGDLVSYAGVSQEIISYERQDRSRPRWTGAVFSGMPTYQISSDKSGNLMQPVSRAINGFIPRPAGYFFGGMLLGYLLFALLGVSPWLGIAGAIGMAFTTNSLILFMAGHTSKLSVVLTLPLIAAGVMMTYRGRYLTGCGVFALGMGIALRYNHPQMLYYFAFTLLFYVIGRLVVDVRAGRLLPFAKASGVLLLGLVLALGSGANTLFVTKDYLPQSTRGGAVLSADPATSAGGDAAAAPAPAQKKAGRGGGLSWDYAMQWSNGSKDVLASFVPGAAGGGSGETVSRSSDFGQALRRMGAKIPQTFAAPMYHGSLPFTEGPVYLGAVVLALFIFGLFTASLPARLWVGAGTLVILLISAGKNLEGFNRLLFDGLPLFNNFRTPSSAASVLPFPMIALGIFGIHRWYQRRGAEGRPPARPLLRAGVIAAGLGALAALVFPLFMDFTSATDPGSLQQMLGQAPPEALLGALEDTRRDLYRSDAWRTFLFLGLTFGVLYLLWRGTITLLPAAILLGVLLAVDNAGVGNRYYSKEDFKLARNKEAIFNQTAADKTILADPDPHFRVYNLTRPLDQDGFTSYYHKSLGGYSAAKLRRYQDLIDGYLAKRDPDVINMLNTKYLIVPGEGQSPQARENPGAFGNGWLVRAVKPVATADEEFAALGTVDDLRNTAIVHEEWSDAVAGLAPTGQGEVRLTSYHPDELNYRIRAEGGRQLAVFSEIWYGPDKGWYATIDGQPAELFRVNYLLRGLVIPEGEHDVRVYFAPRAASLGYWTSLICSTLVLLLVLGGVTYKFLRRQQVDNTATPTAHVQ